ncbi:MAG: hypothetical protein EBR33_12770, partial [Synechococcaceae bacterium WB4_1_0192]|nr:hypothetical protein [Synechococcaceae bacterium WB4_1_0192]
MASAFYWYPSHSGPVRVLTQAPSQGATRIAHGGNGLVGWSASAALSSGDVLVLDEPHPGFRAEHITVSSSASALLTASAALAFDYDRQPIVRWHDCWPALTLDPDEDAFLGSDSARRTWDMRLPLV